jgi:hypothetical protein
VLKMLWIQQGTDFHLIFFGNGADLVGFSSPSLLTIGPASTTQWKRYILILGNQTEIRLNSGKFSPIEAVRGA